MRKLIMTQDKAAKMLCCSRRTIVRLLEEGKLQRVPGSRGIPLRGVFSYAVAAGILTEADAEQLMADALETARKEMREAMA